MYRDVEDLNAWDDADKRLGRWRKAFTSAQADPERT